MPENEDLDHLVELHRQALQRNGEAKARLQKLNEYGQELNIRLSRQSSSSKEQALHSHLDNIRLQRQYNRLQTLSHYATRTDSVAKEDGIYESLPLLLPSRHDHHHVDASSSRAQNEVDELLKHAKSLTTDIELALVKARQNLKREEALLSEVQRSVGVQSRGQNGMLKLRALEVTRDEIQRWVEESLAQCEQSNGDKLNGTLSRETTSDAQQTQIDMAYENYLEKRRHLIDMVKLLERPMFGLGVERERPPARSTPSAERQSRLLQPAPSLRQYRRSSSHLEESSGASLSEIQNASLPRYRHEKLLNTYLSHLIEQAQLQDTALLQSLGRLSHESHLLPSHPNSNSRGENLDQGLTRQQTEANELLRAWEYASEAAAQVRDQNIESQATEAQNLLRQTELDMEELTTIENMRREVLGKENKAA